MALLPTIIRTSNATVKGNQSNFLSYPKELERMPDDAKIASLDMNELLSNFIKQNYDNTIVRK